MKITTAPKVKFTPSKDFTKWLESNNCSIAVAMPRQNKLISFGQIDQKLNVFDRTIEGCSSICTTKNKIYVGAKHQIWKFQNILPAKQKASFDALYWPKQSWNVGDVDIHDMYVHEGIPPIFVNALFSCIATIDEEYSFKVIWKPDFISELQPEDRCHMTGMAVDPERKIPRYITALGKTDSYEEWRLDYIDGGILVDITSNKIIAENLSLPYSPRLYNKNIYLLEAGRGMMVKIDPKTKKKEDLCFVPGFARGLDFIGNYAVIGTSKPREKKTFTDLELDKALKKQKRKPVCGLHLLNLDTNKIDHSIQIDGPFEDIYDIKIIRGKTACSYIGFKGQDIENVFYLDHD